MGKKKNKHASHDVIQHVACLAALDSYSFGDVIYLPYPGDGKVPCVAVMPRRDDFHTIPFALVCRVLDKEGKYDADRSEATAQALSALLKQVQVCSPEASDAFLYDNAGSFAGGNPHLVHLYAAEELAEVIPEPEPAPDENDKRETAKRAPKRKAAAPTPTEGEEKPAAPKPPPAAKGKKSRKAPAAAALFQRPKDRPQPAEATIVASAPADAEELVLTPKKEGRYD